MQWKKLGGNLRVHSASVVTHGISNLNFANIDESDGGEYECQAISDGKIISRSVWLFDRGIGSIIFVLQNVMYMYYLLFSKMLFWV